MSLTKTKTQKYPIVFIMNSDNHSSMKRAIECWKGNKQQWLGRMSVPLHEALLTVLNYSDGYVNDKWSDAGYYYVEFDNDENARNAHIHASLATDCMEAAFRFSKADQNAILRASNRIDNFGTLKHGINKLIEVADEYAQTNSRIKDLSCLDAGNIEQAIAFLEGEEQCFLPVIKNLLASMRP